PMRRNTATSGPFGPNGFGQSQFSCSQGTGCQFAAPDTAARSVNWRGDKAVIPHDVEHGVTKPVVGHVGGFQVRLALQEVEGLAPLTSVVAAWIQPIHVEVHDVIHAPWPNA